MKQKGANTFTHGPLWSLLNDSCDPGVNRRPVRRLFFKLLYYPSRKQLHWAGGEGEAKKGHS